MLEGEDCRHASYNTPADEELAMDLRAVNPDKLIEWVKSQEQWAKKIARDDRRYGEASLMLTYAKELLALLECSIAASARRSVDTPAIRHGAAADIAVLARRIAQLRTGAQSLRRDYSGRFLKGIQ